MKVEERSDVICSFCDRNSESMNGSMFNREGKAAICTDCIQICLEILCSRAHIVNFKPVSSEHKDA